MKLFKDSKKYFTVFFICLLLVIIAGFISPVVIEKEQNNWGYEIKGIINSIESSVTNELNDKQKNLLKDFYSIKSRLRTQLIHGKTNAASIKATIDELNLSEYSFEIISDKSEIIFWNNSIAVPEEKFFPLKFNTGEVHFYNSDLTTFLSVFDSIKSPDTFWIVLNQPVEKHYNIYNKYYKRVSLESDFSEEFSSSFEIEYSPLAQKTSDGRKYSVEIKNNFNKKIGMITFDKPARDVEINHLKDLFINIQALLIIIGAVFLGAGFYTNIKHLHNTAVKILLTAIFLLVFRGMLFILKVPSRFAEGALTNSSFFASTFGFGIVRSPIELFITAIIVLIICILIFNDAVKKSSYSKEVSYISYIRYMILVLISLPLFFILLRGLGASIKSVIFDSSLRYFKEPGLIPNFPAGLMELNILILGIASVLVSVTIILLLLKYYPAEEKSKTIKFLFAVFFVLFQITGFLYDYTQKEPQGTPVIRIIYIVFIFLVVYRIYFRSFISLYNYVYFSLISSIITISLLNFYNTKLEKESLKTTALELTRTNNDLLEFLVRETLLDASTKRFVIRTIKHKNTNYAAKAFLIWSQSSFQRENLNSSITILDKEKQILGTFGIGIEDTYRVNPDISGYSGEELKLSKYQDLRDGGTILTGIVPIKEDGITLGYISASILYNPENYRLNNYPQFLAADYNPINSTVDFNNLRIFDFKDNQLVNVFGDITPANEHITSIVNNKDLLKNNEAWSNLNINNEDYITYSLKVSENGETRIIAVLLKEKNISWSLYNFLKVFFIHSIIIGLFLAVIFFLQLERERNIKYTFKTQLLIAFLLVSIFPIIFLAFYNKYITTEKNNEYIIGKLKERAVIIEDYVKKYLERNPNEDLIRAFENSAADLNIDFSIYNNNKLFYSSNHEFYNSGLLSKEINPLAFSKLENEGYKEYFTNENIEDYSFRTFYNKIPYSGTEYILKINDAFNKIPIQLTGEEVSIFLFGSYSLAMLLVIIFSAVMANRISSPIRSLTKATASVAGGDLDYEVKLNQKGEIRDLINGFNYMIKELKKNQIELSEHEREIAWKEMARQVAHEIKNPLTPMKLAVQQLVIAYKDKQDQKTMDPRKFDNIFDKVTKTVINQIETLNNIASEFSSFARMPNLKLETFDVRISIDDAANLFLEEKAQIKINRKEIPILIAGDRDQLKRTLINLIRNAIQAGATIINLNLNESDGFVNLEIVDNGSGIPAENINRVFEPNFTTKEKGMGLGLKMAKKFIESIKGKICVAESSNEGTKILIQLPKVQPL